MKNNNHGGSIMEAVEALAMDDDNAENKKRQD
jgi:hypothetical protein